MGHPLLMAANWMPGNRGPFFDTNVYLELGTLLIPFSLGGGE